MHAESTRIIADANATTNAECLITMHGDVNSNGMPETEMASDNWRLWCRLCAKEDPMGNISVFFKDEQQQQQASGGNAESAAAVSDDMSLEAAIGKYFWIHITRHEDLPKMLCTECFTLITALENFSERIGKVQQMFATLKQQSNAETHIDNHVVRLKFGLLDEEREHVLLHQQQQQQQQQALTEVHYFEAKPKINELEEKLFESDIIMSATEAANSTETNTALITNPLEQQTRIKIKIKKEHVMDETLQVAVLADKAVYDNDNDNDDNNGENDIDNIKNDNVDDAVDPFNGADSSDNVNDVNEADDDDNDDDDGDDDFTPNKSAQKHANSSSSAEEADMNTAARDLKLKSKPKKRIRRSKRKHAALSESDTKSDEAQSETELCQNKANSSATAAAALVNNNNSSSSSNASIIFKCTECPRKFKRVQHYRQHMKRTHSKVAPMPEMPCPQCARSFTTRNQLERHVKVHLPLALKKVLPCPYCDKKFTSNTLVQTHIKYIHMNERPFICEECGVAVRTNAALKTHMLTHTDYAPFECEVCKKGFKNHIRLKNHMETHDPNKHICAECGLQLNSRATLNRHLLVHSDEMQHKCDYCGRAFKRAKALKNHLILHTGLKPYSCDFCDRTFANGSNCRSHKKKAHPEELAALEAAGGGKTYTRNIPKLDQLKAVTKAADNLAPVVSKQSGRFAFGKKPKPLPKDEASEAKSIAVLNKQAATKQTPVTLGATTNHLDLRQMQEVVTSPTTSNELLGQQHQVQIAADNAASIPTIDNIYNHIMKQATIAAQNATALEAHEGNSTTTTPITAATGGGMTIHIKRPPSQASSSCMSGLEHDVTSDVPHLQQHLLQQSHHLQQQHQQQAHALIPPTTVTHFYSQIVKQTNLIHVQQQMTPANLQQQPLLHHHHSILPVAAAVVTQNDDINSIRSPDSQASHLTDDHSNASAHFYNDIRQNLQGPFM